MINEKVLNLCKKSIQTDIGSMSDLPYELANTVANYYYKFHSLFLDLKTHPLPAMVSKEENIFTGIGKYLNEAEMMLPLIKCLPGLVKGLRQIDNKSEYEFLLNLILDVYKYDIKNATSKIGLRRMIERQFKTVNEIPNLIDLM